MDEKNSDFFPDIWKILQLAHGPALSIGESMARIAAGFERTHADDERVILVSICRRGKRLAAHIGQLRITASSGSSAAFRTSTSGGGHDLSEFAHSAAAWIADTVQGLEEREAAGCSSLTSGIPGVGSQPESCIKSGSHA